MAAALSYRDPWPGARRCKFYVAEGSRVAVFDCETTGLKAAEDRIIQWSLITYVMNGGRLEEDDRMDVYINPEKPIPPKITELTGISDATLKDALPMRNRILEIKKRLESADVWAGYNVPFDIRMLDGESEICHVWIRHSPVIDVLEIARDYLRKETDVENYKLGTVTKFLFPEADLRFHDSLDDVRATAAILEWGCKKAANLSLGEDVEPEVYLKGAYWFVNPKRKSQKRICLVLSEGERGDVFYDVIARQWSCKTSTQAKNLFKGLIAENGMRHIERAVLKKYGFTTMDEMAEAWQKKK